MIKFREMVPADLIHVGPMYEEMVKEAEKQPGWIPYPKMTPQATDDLVLHLLTVMKIQQRNEAQGHPALWKGFVAAHGSVPKGFLTVEIGERPNGEPKRTVLGTIFYVDPGFRGRGIGLDLIKMAHEWAVKMGAKGWEAHYVPGTYSHKMWAKAGFKTYFASGILVDENWEPIMEMEKFVDVWKNLRGEI
jgi:GNAT superfamily N-acetyltransferase